MSDFTDDAEREYGDALAEGKLDMTDNERLREEVERKVSSWFTEPVIAVEDEVLALVAREVRLGRLDELGSVQLDYGNYQAQTFIDSQAMTVAERYQELEKENT